jgi:MFS superfamily sulfate permease-like transporter
LIRRLRFDLAELSGALGDLGTFIPLAVSLIAVSGMDAGSVLVFAGLLNVVTGLVFGLPLPVQPMKAIAAVAIAEALAPGEIAAAGFVAGAIVLVLGLTGVVELVERWVPRPVVRGIQLGVGIKLAAKGIGMTAELPWWGADSVALALGGAALVLATARLRRFPTALILLAVGLVLAVLAHSGPIGDIPLGWAGPAWVWPSAEQWLSGTLRGALPQVPLTLLNSVIAVGILSEDLFPGRGVRARPMALSVGLMNVATCLLGAMPVCHGSGGLAGQYRFGARTGGSVVALGAVKLGLGLLFGTAAIALLQAIPAAVLGVLLAFAGFELALPARDCVKRDAFFTAVVTAAGILAVNTAVGFAVGLVAALALLRREVGEDRPGP